ncbi:winged helix DNA-binding domain-containing protein [Planomonospora sp. ID67723]|uniref:winged helix DNA-binding domain-containing protein n=1 Tax=Planomonospora sp. ID67723 TaxID=2738134 RepID=UPI0018C42C62|nr:winged helix DNA-binding domain-containing protein [Planomonospora sp. ID67723]MBG0829870.1 winged helix DNA-binding domain-containing protein [Planomonospora sp. ID67723]
MTLLGPRALNRATLDRQLLLRRSELTVPQALERLAGLQAQSPHTWYIGLWSRLADYAPEGTARLLRERAVVRMALMRSTIHLVTAADCLWLRPLVEPVIERMTMANFRRGLAGLDRAELVAAGRELLAERPMAFSELGRALAGRWPDNDPASMAQAIRASVPLVQVPPRGVWGESGPAAHQAVETWLGRPVETGASLERLVLRYLAAFGPATVRDVQHWCGLTRLGEIVERLRPGLAVFRDERGRELFDLPDAPRPDADTPAPVRFVYDYDNLLRSHADLSRLVTVDYAAQGFGMTGEEPSSVLVDGFAAATWKLVTRRGTATLTVRPFRKLTGAEEEAVSAEGAALLAFAAAGAKARDIVFAPPQPG